MRVDEYNPGITLPRFTMICMLTLICCRELMLGLSANVNQPAVHVDLSCNDMKSEGGLVLGGCVANLKNIHGLDLSDNGKCLPTFLAP